MTGSWKTTFEQAAAAYDGPITNLATRYPRRLAGPAAPVGGVRPLDARRLTCLRPADRRCLMSGGDCPDVFRADTLGWSEVQFGVDLPWSVFPLLSVAIGVATWGICQLRRAKSL